MTPFCPAKTLLTAVAAVLLTAPAAQAQLQTLQPGLWQYDVKLKSQSGQVEKALSEAQQRLAQLPPEQRKAVEKMMAEKGVNLDAGGTTLKSCLSAQDAQQNRIPLNLQKENCSQTQTATGGGTLKVAFSCQSDPPVQGTGEITVLSPTAITGKAQVDTLVDGKADRLHLNQQGRWLSSDCGQIAPSSK